MSYAGALQERGTPKHIALSIGTCIFVERVTRTLAMVYSSVTHQGTGRDDPTSPRALPLCSRRNLLNDAVDVNQLKSQVLATRTGVAEFCFNTAGCAVTSL
jgi:hypothetical protein